VYVGTAEGVFAVDLENGDVLATNRNASVLCCDAMALGPGPGQLTVGSSSGEVLILDSTTLNVLQQVGVVSTGEVGKNSPTAVVIVPGTEPLIAAATAKEVAAWRITGMGPEEAYRVASDGELDLSVGLALTSDASRLIVGFNLGWLTLDVQTGETLATLSTYCCGWPIRRDPLDRENSRFLIGTPNTHLVTSDLSSTAALPGKMVAGAAFSPDGTFAVTASAEGLALYDIATETQFGSTITHPFGPVGNLAFVPGTMRFITFHSSSSGELLVMWDPDPSNLVDKACQLAARNLSQAEWAQYLGDRPYHATCPQYPVGE
jgi:hypothetical protein